MNEIDVSQLLSQMRAMAARAADRPDQGGASAGSAGFSTLLRQSIDQVNTRQQQSEALQQAFLAGDPKVDLAQVMVALQKASISFEAMTQVRNKLVAAYQEIMGMQI